MTAVTLSCKTSFPHILKSTACANQHQMGQSLTKNFDVCRKYVCMRKQSNKGQPEQFVLVLIPIPVEECFADTQSVIQIFRRNFRSGDFMNVDACLKEVLKMEETKVVLTIAKTCSTFEIWRCPLLLGKKWKTYPPGNFNPLLILRRLPTLPEHCCYHLDVKLTLVQL